MSGFEVQLGQPRNAAKAAGSWLGASHAVCGVQRSGSATLVLVAACGRQNGCSQWAGVEGLGPVAADKIDLALGRDEAVGLIGRSGSGKTTTALAVLGLLPAGAQVTGSIRVVGVEVVELRPGRVVEHGDTTRVLARPAHRKTQELVAAARALGAAPAP